MNIALCGYGNMGKEFEQIALQRGHTVTLKIGSKKTVTQEELKQAEVAMEFSTPYSVKENIYKCFNANIPVVVGTTGWYVDFEEVKNKCAQNKQSLFYATNY